MRAEVLPQSHGGGWRKKKAGRILLVRRAVGQTYAGKWCIPCGHIEWGEDVRAALGREMKEETGLTVEAATEYAVYSNFHRPDALSVGCWFRCEVSGVPRAGDDADRIGWFYYDECPDLAFPTDREVLERLQRDGYLKGV
ncbi:MAG: NUDIX domain-containing protein [Veillonellaceae bacterium]|nr:NUDIX domain-containing protein [Veillonellaceae bacterium]